MSTQETTPQYPVGDTSRLSADPWYREARDEAPVAKVRMPYGGEAWLAVRHSSVRTAQSDPRFSRAASAELGEEAPRMVPGTPPVGSVLTMDGPDHTRVRRFMAKAFTVRRIEKLRPRVQEIVDGLLDEMVAHGSPADLKKFVAEPLPVMVICEVLGVPVAERADFRVLTETIMSGVFTSDEAQASIAQFLGYLNGLVAAKRAEPGEDVLSTLVTAVDGEDRLSEIELASLAVALLVGGHETILNTVLNFTYTLLTTPDELAKLRDRPELINQAVEELLRHVPINSGGAFGTVAREDVEFGDVTVRAGETLVADIASANRDADVFPDADVLDLDRKNIQHLTFGFGPHHCIGAQLARLDLQVTLGTLLRRFPELRLAVEPEDVKWREGVLIRGVEALPVAW
ncbi:cytochrome P450 [Umezawaea endophytica]|uniref:Cytochrome P450 n=1 Tax=Umezawaea endophytica TaxID=1654476 RepID=A0A9X3AJ51_9PSEU|nr:cytochrome P450 [Umezawaea endophytica]MCS7483511.1 cytochrome P450 [Umezawaea endophytica]